VQLTTAGDPQLVRVTVADLAAAQAALKTSACHYFEADAGKSYGLSLDPAILAKPVGIEGSGAYTTIAVVKKSKLDADAVTNFCGVVANSGYRASHTGFMKSAGWISPMGATQDCISTAGTVAQQAACRDLTKSGETCHNSAFGKSCVPGMKANDSPFASLTTDGADTNEICAQCDTRASCANVDTASYYNYFGAAKALLDDKVDIAFIKTATIECPTYPGYCKTTAQAACTAAGNCDSKSVYAKGYTVAADTYVKLPGYAVEVPAHVLVQKGVLTADNTKIANVLKGTSSVAGTDGAYFAGMNKALIDKSADASVEVTIGTAFTAVMRNIPYFYAKNGLTRPAGDSNAVYVNTATGAPTPAAASSATATGATVTVAAVAAVVAGLLL